MATTLAICRPPPPPDFRLSPRHCEEPLRRSNPESLRGTSLDCFASLAMTRWRAISPAPGASPRRSRA
ncbi:hypothetical protein EAS62_08835 [Bradyrhizobium zhanjiangense]|uniref:Uncharacterized protein n=1 Tax=Bradyrhizobium zhanjiangense TaxID=1325107 RepID=A0ABY0DNS9_9BRAD|nr:hypothetical protein EAS62_08835 [Bradyrhizobium zhanjiangense]